MSVVSPSGATRSSGALHLGAPQPLAPQPLAPRVAGVDEVGRGPLAGPVVAAAVILPAGALAEEVTTALTDSKKVPRQRRQALAAAIGASCPVSVAQASVEEIDGLNIRRAALLAMRRALEGLEPAPAEALIDGADVPDGLTCPARAIIRGDSLEPAISAASIVAKVARDSLMAELGAEFPGYGWESNAGYGTQAHRAAIQRLGVTPHHRRSFAGQGRLFP